MATLIQELSRAADLINVNLKAMWAQQGHHLTGAWEKSLFASFTADIDGFELEGKANNYGGIVDAGTTPDRIPYGGNPGAAGVAKTSKYITGLVNYFRLRGLSEDEAIRAAFATANKQKQEGMSTIASQRFSSTGKRQHFIQAVAEAVAPDIDNMVLIGLASHINTLADEPQQMII